jgi:hypothetical protein
MRPSVARSSSSASFSFDQMTTSEQAAVMLEAMRNNLLRMEDVIHWVDDLIVAMDKPPGWLIELSAMEQSHIVDVIARLREHADTSLAVRRQVQVIVTAYDCGLLSFRESLPLLFRVVLVEGGKKELDAAGECLADALVRWDFQDNLDCVSSDLRATFEAIFRDFRATAFELLPFFQEARRRKIEQAGCTEPGDNPSIAAQAPKAPGR